jgi:hypothetical protein
LTDVRGDRPGHVVLDWHADPVEQSRTTHWGFPHEQELLETALTELPELDLVDQGSLALGNIVLKLDPTKCRSEGIGHALTMMALFGFRAARAGGLLIAGGYSAEALGHARRLAELSARAEFIVEDGTGQRAVAWLSGRGKRPASLVGREFWDLLSPAAHADIRHLDRITSAERGTQTQMFANRFETDWLVSVMIAMWVKDLAVTACREGGMDEPAVLTLDRRIDAAIESRDRQLAFW